ncbi:dihydrofolate reductase [Marinibacterium profundimaris]|uniref:Dihydrofolate reductase n=1 Tax=Marinibacterium profundimaris TaxID=1679460 RepID=A0A225NP53_9RHOB|nr:dihydrofolate reductase [Marinibacterium profundimaris]OWU76122.1 dihydrofolate reductase [Marinibacterium profundimaris]
MITLLVARARNGAIGRDGTMPWSLPEDLAHFREATTGGALIMGARTWRSLPRRPLPDRLNCVVSSDPDLAEHVFPSPAEAVRFAREAGHQAIHGIGGARVYADLMPLADRMLISEVELDVEDADTFFPDFDETGWTCCQTTLLRRRNPMCILRDLRRRT